MEADPVQNVPPALELDAPLEPLGGKIRRRRKELGLTLDEVSGRTRVSKPYLSLIETGRVTNPPSDEKLRRLEHALGFVPGELVSQAHLQRTPRDVRAMLVKLLRRGLSGKGGEGDDSGKGGSSGSARRGRGKADAGTSSSRSAAKGRAVETDAAWDAGILQQLVERDAGSVERIHVNAVPVINGVAAGYPQDFTDMSYPPRVAEGHVGVPDLADPEAFACRVWGDSMAPKFSEGDIVIFSPARGPRDGDDCFIRFDDGRTTFKRVFFEQNEAEQGVIRLQPRNERYRPETVPSERISGLYKAVYRYQRLDEG